MERAIRLPHATSLVVGTIIGASIFVQPSVITGQVPTPAGVYLVWLVCGVLSLFGALVCAELASIFTRTGGVYVYLSEAFSPALGFLWGWAMFWTMHSGIIAAVATICARYLGFFVPVGELGTKLMAVGVVLILSAVNYLGVRHGSSLQTWFTAGKLAAIALIIAGGFLLGPREPLPPATAASPLEGVTAGNFLLALVAGLFAFGGWHMVTYNAEETVEPRKTIPRALLLGTALVTVCYVALNAVYLHVLPLEQVSASSRVAADAADAVLGYGGGAAMSTLVIFSTFGALSGIVLAGPRVYYAMARDGLLFGWLAHLHPRFHTPHRAIVAQAVWSSVLILTGSYRALFTRVVYTEWIFFGLMTIGLFLFRRRPELTRDYRIWGYPVVPALFAASSFAIVAHQIVSDPVESMTGLLLVVVGFPIYARWARPRRAAEPAA